MNLILPGNPRYQPRSLVPIFGYDHLVKPQIEVELALVDTLTEVGIIPPGDFALLTHDIRANVMAITTTMVDTYEFGRDTIPLSQNFLLETLRDILPSSLKRLAGFFELAALDVSKNMSAADWFTKSLIEALGYKTDLLNQHALTLKQYQQPFEQLVLERTRKINAIRHDVRALVRLIQERVPMPLRRWIHFPATSYDIIHTAMSLMYRRAWQEVTSVALNRLMDVVADMATTYKNVRQIGRTHGQHAIPITVGFWLATILGRLLHCRSLLHETSNNLVGKFSGAVGAYNAQVLFGLTRAGEKPTFEERVLAKLGLTPAPISTQILPPEPLMEFLHAHVLLAGVLGQISRDCRHLERPEIAEIVEPREAGVVGSSTMAHKVNPTGFENAEGMYWIIASEYGKALYLPISEHQRDLVASSLMRELPGIVIFVQYQLERLFRILQKIEVNPDALTRNLGQNAHVYMAEPLYLALQLGGYEGDAHAFVNDVLVPQATPGKSIVAVFQEMAAQDEVLHEVWERIPEHIRAALNKPEDYIGLSIEKALEIMNMV